MPVSLSTGENMKIQAIEITFPVLVELPPGFEQTLSCLVGMVCKAYEKSNPTRTMWPAGHGFKPTFIPMTAEQEKERGAEFDESTYSIEVCERQAHESELNRRVFGITAI